MIYVLISTQLLTVMGMLVAMRWGIAYFEDRDKHDRAQVNSFVEEMARQQVSHEDQIRGLITEHQKHVRELLGRAHREREMLIERYQFPEQMQAQAQTADMPSPAEREGSPVVMDERRMYDLEHPDQPHEQLEPVQPLQAKEPVTPFGKA